ncbi:hypothetical protein COEREDRAFT_80867 [Coemansia reversa NRRL 1564]|uniref:Uncharacterized protein n=1 Tax=Coemansia reversa (strain ATCC 12441 / NRRL 1564) TaxID=763665 RepID=A0A2G5BDK4_COERN|nr:hypothetical protein COEREDRAFT_80867 [Coemansia reversa NRRL 1564]|eukprot:PIA16787.1 hypothetical protein COEREDRAFT_80867 [Coemansia reversa NRRL 1564]
MVQQPQQWQLTRRCFSSKVDLDKEIETITDLATTAKDEMDFAEESRNSVYYNSDKVTAHEAVEELSTAYNGLLNRLSDTDKESIKTRIGMKVKEIQSAYEIMTQNDMED